MESSPKQHLKQLQAKFEPGFRRMLVASLLLHLLMPLIYNLSFFGNERVKPPVYRVNLVNKPVKNPQAGRPEATMQKAKPKPEPKAKSIPPKPIEKPVPPKPKPKPAPVKPKAEPSKPQPPSKPAVSKAQNTARLDALAALQEKLEQKNAETQRKERLDALRAAALAESQQIESPITDAPVGMADGKGDEAGVTAVAFVREFIQQQWILSQYQVSGNPESEAILLYNADGQLLHYRFVKKSGNSTFDESLTKAINKSKQLNQPLPEQMEFHIIFNLKEMLGRK